ncbi:hypothetical protein GW17_00038030 [Ensete ventricosum]|nr:hypothetical protein GW17_00038030 [Ensete ventricosum]RZR86220.1 hypothetical protein BHM03_00013372 [Ensete ventricosum]
MGGACGQKHCPRAQQLAARRPLGGRLQDAHKGLPLAGSPAASKGGDADRRGGHPLAGQHLVGKGSRRLRKGSGDDGGIEGARGRRGGSVEVTAGPTMSWREIITHSDATI